MTEQTAPDVREMHRFFAMECYNRTWELLDKPNRTPEDEEQMTALTMASLWHWTQRPDCTNQNRSIGYWQASRVFAVLRIPDAAERFGTLCLRYAQDQPAFYQAYAYEALARAAQAAGDHAQRDARLSNAQQLAEQIEDAEERAMLERDLATLG